MKKCNYVSKEQDRNFLEELSVLEGKVTFVSSEIFSESVLRGFRNISLELDSRKRGKPIWIRGEHRVDIGEKVRLHYQDMNGSNADVVLAYEILNKNGSVKYRHAEKFCKFIPKD